MLHMKKRFDKSDLKLIAGGGGGGGADEIVFWLEFCVLYKLSFVGHCFSFSLLYDCVASLFSDPHRSLCYIWQIRS